MDQEKKSEPVTSYQDAKRRVFLLCQSGKYMGLLYNSGASPLFNFLLNRLESLEKEVNELKTKKIKEVFYENKKRL